MAGKRINDGFASHIGLRIRARRLQLKMSQENLADALGITFQQVQKYEKGTNSVRADRLVAVAKALNVSPAYFFEGIVEGKIDAFVNDEAQFLSLPYSTDIALAFGLMSNDQRKALANVAMMMAPPAQAKAA